MSKKKDQIDQPLLQNQTKETYVFDALTPKVIWGYAVGHIFNDLCASSWFNFVLFYLTKVLNFEQGSYTMLFGQIADALGTPSAGILSDKYNTRFGKRTPWYVLSFVMVLITFLPMWCFPIMKDILPLENESFKTFFFIFFPAAFNYFWAFGYIAHISLVPSMTCSRVRRDTLNTRRNTFTFFANMLLLLLALFFFQIIEESEQQFQAIGISIAIIGSIFCIIFFITVKEVPLTKACNSAVTKLKIILKQKQDAKKAAEIGINKSSDISSIIHSVHHDHNESKPKSDQEQQQENDNFRQNEDIMFSITENKFFNSDSENQNLVNSNEENQDIKEKNPLELRISQPRKTRGESLSDHVVSWNRLFCNVTTTMLNFYLYYVIDISDSASDGSQVKLTFQLALIPLLLYIASVGASSILNTLYLKIGRKMTFSLGILLMFVSLIPLLFLSKEDSTLKNLIYPLALLIGASQALQLNTSINLISEVIGLRGAGGAFVFGAYSFLDKLVTGIVLFMITESQDYKDNNPTFIKWVIVIVPIASGVGAWILILLGKAKDYDKTNKQKTSRMSLGDEFVN